MHTCWFNRTLICHVDIIMARLEAVDVTSSGACLDIGAAKLNASLIVLQEPGRIVGSFSSDIYFFLICTLDLPVCSDQRIRR